LLLYLSLGGGDLSCCFGLFPATLSIRWFDGGMFVVITPVVGVVGCWLLVVGDGSVVDGGNPFDSMVLFRPLYGFVRTQVGHCSTSHHMLTTIALVRWKHVGPCAQAD
jgi:hypothetical protein